MFNNETKVVELDGYTFFYVYDFLPPDVMEDLVRCVEVDTNAEQYDQAWEVRKAKEIFKNEMTAEEWRRWSHVLGVTDDLTKPYLEEKGFWNAYHVRLQYYLQEYLKVAGLSYPTIEWASTWFLRSKNITYTDLEKFHKPYDESGKIYVDKQHHTHLKTHVVGCVYYLKSPSETYGTAVEFNGHKFISPGKENSILFFDPRLPHSRTVPSPELSAYPRHAVITDFKVEEQLGNIQTLITSLRERSVMRRWEKLGIKPDLARLTNLQCNAPVID